jgi:hypothetical protein
MKNYAWIHDPNTNVVQKLEQTYGKEEAAKLIAVAEREAEESWSEGLPKTAVSTQQQAHH